jgi:hypothetical protein
MSVAAFVEAARAGRVPAGAGGMDPRTGGLADGTAPLDAGDLEALTAEAYNQDVLPADLPWARGLELVRAGLEGRVEVLAAWDLAASFDETKHPRHGKGVREGGRFREKDDAGSSSSEDLASSAPILEGVSDADMADNAERMVEDDRPYIDAASDASEKAAAAAYDKRLAEELAKLREEPLVHATSAEAAAMIWADDGELRSRIAMQDDIAEAEDELRDLIREQLPTVTEEQLARRDFLEAVDMDLLAGADADPEVWPRIQGLQRVMSGTTFPEDEKLGLDRFVFFHHGRTSAQYGTTDILVDNAQLNRAGFFATPRDIVLYARATGDKLVGRAFSPITVRDYRADMVNDGGYWQAAAAARVNVGSGVAPALGAAGSFEVKLPNRVNRKAIRGFIAGTLEDYDRLLEAGVPEQRVYYLPTDAHNYTARFRMAARHGQLRGDFSTFPKYDELPDGTERDE